jgi:hypothetical protein
MQEESIPEEGYEFRELFGGRRYNRKNTEVERRDSCSEPEGREPCTLARIMEVPYLGGEEDEFHSILIIEEPTNPTQIGSHAKSMTPCVSPH